MEILNALFQAICRFLKERAGNKLPGFGEAIFLPGKAREGSLA
jgi:hypothetical protein